MAGLAFAAAGYALSGFLAHRFGTRNVLLMSASSMIIGTVGTADSATLNMLVLFQGVTGLSEGLFYVAALVILTETFDGSRIGRAIGSMESAVNVGIVIALTTGAAVTAMFGWRTDYIVLTGLGFIAVFLILKLSREGVSRFEQTDMRRIIGDPYIKAVVAPAALLLLSFWSFWAFVPTYFVNSLKIPLTIAGAISSTSFLLAIFAAYAGGFLADQLGPKVASLTVVGIYTVGLVVFALTRNLLAVLVSLAIVTFAQAYLVPVIFAFMPKRFPQSELGRAFGIIISVAYIAGAVGPLLVGRITDTFGFRTAFLVLALCVGTMGALILQKL